MLHHKKKSLLQPNTYTTTWSGAHVKYFTQIALLARYFSNTVLIPNQQQQLFSSNTRSCSLTSFTIALLSSIQSILHMRSKTKTTHIFHQRTASSLTLFRCHTPFRNLHSTGYSQVIFTTSTRHNNKQHSFTDLRYTMACNLFLHILIPFEWNTSTLFNLESRHSSLFSGHLWSNAIETYRCRKTPIHLLAPGK